MFSVDEQNNILQHISLIDSVIDVAQWLVIAYYTLTDSVVYILQLHSA